MKAESTKQGDILKKALLFLLFALLFSSASAEPCAYFFYGEGCLHCGRVEPFVAGLEDVEMHDFEVYNNRSNLLVLMDYFDAFGVPDDRRGVPVVFIDGKYLVGDKPILENLEAEIKNNPDAECPAFKKTNITGIAGETSPLEEFKTLSLVTIIGAALVDSINPCAIAVLLILLGALLAAGDKERAIKAGFAFTFAIYIAYFLFGLGLYSVIQISGLSYWFYKIIGVIAIIVGLANIKDYFWYGGAGFVMEIPKKWRPSLKNLLRKVTSPVGAFFMGFVVTLFELPCTGGPYLFVLGLLAEKTTRLVAIPILLMYNLFFVLPLLIITLFVYLGLTNIEKAEKWKDKNIRLLHLIAGVVMLGLGLLVVTGIV